MRVIVITECGVFRRAARPGAIVVAGTCPWCAEPLSVRLPEGSDGDDDAVCVTCSMVAGRLIRDQA